MLPNVSRLILHSHAQKQHLSVPVRQKRWQVETEMQNHDKIYSTELAQPQDWCLHSGMHLYDF